jgi:hypothetical protein
MENIKELKNKDNTSDNSNLLGSKRERDDDEIKINKIKPDLEKEKVNEAQQLMSPLGTTNQIPAQPLTNTIYPNYNMMSAIPQTNNYGYYATQINYYPQQNFHSKTIFILFINILSFSKLSTC